MSLQLNAMVALFFLIICHKDLWLCLQFKKSSNNQIYQTGRQACTNVGQQMTWLSPLLGYVEKYLWFSLRFYDTNKRQTWQDGRLACTYFALQVMMTSIFFMWQTIMSLSAILLAL